MQILILIQFLSERTSGIDKFMAVDAYLQDLRGIELGKYSHAFGRKLYSEALSGEEEALSNS